MYTQTGLCTSYVPPYDQRFGGPCPCLQGLCPSLFVCENTARMVRWLCPSYVPGYVPGYVPNDVPNDVHVQGYRYTKRITNQT